MQREINNYLVHRHTFLQFPKIASKQARVSLLELSVGQRVTERIDRTVQVAEKVTGVEEVGIEDDTFTAGLTKRLNDRMDVPLERKRKIERIGCERLLDD